MLSKSSLLAVLLLISVLAKLVEQALVHAINEMLASPVPEIQRTNLGNVVLLLKSFKV